MGFAKRCNGGCVSRRGVPAKKAEKTLGAKFNIGAFHDAVLELGSVPLPIVTARIDRFISEGDKGPYPDMQ